MWNRCSTTNYGLTDGGQAGMVYVYLASFVGFFASVISMAGHCIHVRSLGLCSYVL